MDAQSLQQQYDDGTYPDGFWPWIVTNWHIYEEFCALARRAIDYGVGQWSSDAICHVLRWETAIRERGLLQSIVKINNNATAGLARLAMAREPDLTGFFKTRTPPAHDLAVKLDGSFYGTREKPPVDDAGQFLMGV